MYQLISSESIYKKTVSSGGEALHSITTKINEFDHNKLLKKLPLWNEFELNESEFKADQLITTEGTDQTPHLDSSNLPWSPDVSGLTDAKAVADLRVRILELSKQENTFLLPPPSEGIDCNQRAILESPAHVAMAKALLECDPNLTSIRYKLVPKMISENKFWANYFYRISILRQSAQMSASTEFDHEDDSFFEQHTSHAIVHSTNSTKNSPVQTSVDEPKPKIEKSDSALSNKSDKGESTEEIDDSELNEELEAELDREVENLEYEDDSDEIDYEDVDPDLYDLTTSKNR